ncbi:MAG TPA: type II secretion system minor pseudopilin GspJ [Allosphingosinicella sp.]
MTRRLSKAGFTLVEMLIALTIFGMLTAGGVALLSFSVTSQEMTDRQLATLGSIRRAGALLTADLGQAAARPWRDGNGAQQPAFFGAAGRETRVMVLVRGGWDNPDQLPRASLQRVEYRLQGGRLLRIGYTNVDGGGAAAVTTLIQDVQSLQLRFRDREGLWRDTWVPGDPAELPAAVELSVSSSRFGPVRQLFLVGSGR